MLKIHLLLLLVLAQCAVSSSSWAGSESDSVHNTEMYAGQFGQVQIPSTVRPDGKVGGGDPGLPGHLLPMGKHRPPKAIAETSYPLDPQDFYTNFVLPGRPVLIKGGARELQLDTKWTDKELSRRHGREEVLVERQKKEKRGIEPGVMSLKKFLGSYKKRGIYLAAQPTMELLEDVPLPSLLSCEEMHEHTYTLNMWMSSGGTTSLMHLDDAENVLHMIDGVKRVVLVSPQQTVDVYADEAVHAPTSPIDPEAVDMVLFPRFYNVTWEAAKVEAGDALYIPRGYWHQVNSDPGRNLALNVWWHHPPSSKISGETQDLPVSEIVKVMLDQKRAWPERMTCARPSVFGEKTLADCNWVEE
mmetsp:Transcript_30763/g.70961  ORF Transcript_30763/g.70961 Transcript_30763/m.70961 type:complete len:358 (+) Transcript_30763:96-1169(+)